MLLILPHYLFIVNVIYYLHLMYNKTIPVIKTGQMIYSLAA